MEKFSLCLSKTHQEEKKNNVVCIIVFLIGVTGLSIAVILSHFIFFKYVIGLKVMALNTWGMPYKMIDGSEDKELRMQAIGKYIQKKEYDVYLLSGLWMRPDHETIRKQLPEGYHMSQYVNMSQWNCDGRVYPYYCSGLAIISRYPFIEQEFLEFNYNVGSNPDGEHMARKGAGRALVEPHPGFVVDLFVSHTCGVGSTHNNSDYREHQVQELVGWVDRSKADFVILGGDFNTDPNDNETSYQNLKKNMTSSMEEFFLDIKECLFPRRATYGNPKNTYSSKHTPMLYDYIWHRSNRWNMIWTNLFDVPLLKTLKGFSDSNNTTSTNRAKKVSFSDHEAVTSSLFLWKSIL